MRHGNTLKLALAVSACLSVFSFAQQQTQIAELRINTNGTPQSASGGSCGGGGGGWGMAQTYSFKYVPVTNFQLTDPSNARNNVNRDSKGDLKLFGDSLRLRGNSTSGAAKKPYRIKFGEKTSLFGIDEAKSWVLLANFYDGTFALNAMAFELGQRLGVAAPKYKFVNLYLNNTYMGIYQLTQQIQSNKGLVNVKEKTGGWLVEFDYHDPASDECFNWFSTGNSRYDLTTFIKAPELDELAAEERPNNPKPTAADSAKFLHFVKEDIFGLVNKMAEGSFPNNNYRDLIDLESFAKYVLIQLVLDNFDFNSKTQPGYLPGSNFAYKIDECSKIQAGPIWDFDLAAGVQNNQQGGGIWGGPTGGGFPAHYQSYQDPILPRQAFYDKLWQDPVVKAKYKKAWDKHKSDFQAMSTVIDNISSLLSSNITSKGNNIWANNTMGGSAALTQQQFTTEVSGLKTWLTNRINWVDRQLSNINTSADITESTPTCTITKSSSSNNVANSSSSRNTSSSSANTGSAMLSCTGLQNAVEKGSIIATPNLTCSNGSPSDINWFGGPSSGWNQGINGWQVNLNTFTTSYTIRATAQCGNVSNLNAECGSVTVAEVGTLSSSSSNNTPIVLQQIVGSNGIWATKNGVNLQVQKNARLDIYSLSGKLEKSMNFTNGVHNIPLGNLPKGMYVVRAMFGSEGKTLRVVVR